jgi:macrolide-specific efflux system membrane fusion protein
MFVRSHKLTMLFVVLLIMLCGVFIFFFHKKSTWKPVKVGPVVTAVYGLGTVTSDHIYDLKSGVTNSITQVYVDEGQQVKKGQRLIRYHDGQIVHAPFAGTITSLPVHDHEVVDQQAPILTLMDLKHRYLLVSLDQDSAINVHPGLPVKINFEALNGPAFHGRVAMVYPNNNNFYVRIDLKNLPTSILPQMTGDVAILLKTIPSAIQIPVNAIKNNHITLRVNNKIRSIKIKVGVEENNWARVLSNNVPASAMIRVKS